MKNKLLSLFAVSILLFSGNVLAQQCPEFEDVRNTCAESISNGISDVFSSDDESERAGSAGEATTSCTDCATEFISNTIDNIGGEFESDEDSSD